ncbi:MAG: GNAT family N-acetyltransferase [Planctomycetota bacterium]
MPNPRRDDGFAVTLEPITMANLGAVLALETRADQRRFVATNARSLAQAYVQSDRAWPRAICHDGRPVGFVMLEILERGHPDDPDGRASYFLCRLMVGAEHQGRGYGRAAIALIVDEVRRLPDGVTLKTCYVPGEGGPEGFYRKLGFEPTGVVEDDEVELRLDLQGIASP